MKQIIDEMEEISFEFCLGSRYEIQIISPIPAEPHKERIEFHQREMEKDSLFYEVVAEEAIYHQMVKNGEC